MAFQKIPGDPAGVREILRLKPGAKAPSSGVKNMFNATKTTVAAGLCALAIAASLSPALADTVVRQTVIKVDSFGDKIVKQRFIKTDDSGNEVRGFRVIKTDALGDRVVKTKVVDTDAFGDKTVKTKIVVHAAN
jgi:hypothetical protein